MKSVHNMQLFSKTEDMRSKVRQNKLGENGCCRNYFIKKSLRECMETKKTIFRNSKQRISVVNMNLFVWFMKAKVYKVESCTLYFASNFHTNL